MSKNDVVSNSTREHSGLFNKYHESKVTLNNGKTGTGTGYSKESATSSAIKDANKK